MAKKIRIIPELDESKLRQQLNNIGKKREKIQVDLDSTNISKANKHMQQLNTTVANSNTVFGKLKTTISNTFSASRVTMLGFLTLMQSISKAGREAKQTIQQIDSAITDLSIATNKSRESVSALVRGYNNYAKQLSSTTTQVTSAADAYLRAGKTMGEAEALIQNSLMLSKLGQIESAEATEDLLATMNGFDMSIEEVNSALDAMVAIDMKAATSAGDIATALKYSASSAEMAGLSFNKLAAMIGTVQDKTQQSAETVGTFMNTLLSRYRNVKIGQFINDDGEDLSEVETILESLDIKLRSSNQEFRKFEEVIDEVALNWEEYSSVQQAAIAKAFSGTRQQNRFIALMEGYNKTLELTEVAANSAGTAVEKFNNSYFNSLEAKQNTLQASFESMVINSDFGEVYAGIIEATTALVDFINQTNALKGAFAGLAVTGVIKAFLAFKVAIRESFISLNQFQQALTLVNKTQLSTKEFTRLLMLSKNLSASQTKLILSSNNLTLTQKKQILMNQGLSASEAKLQLQNMGLATSYTGLKAATVSVANACKGLFSTLLANPIMLISTLVAGATMAWQSYKQSVEEANEKTKASAESAKEYVDGISELINRYNSLAEAVKTDASAKEELLTTQSELIKKLGLEGENLDELISKYGSLSKAINQVSIDSLKRSQIDLTAGIDVARDELLDVGNDGFWAGNNIISATGDDAVKAFKELEKAGIIGSASYGTGGGALTLTGDDSTVEGILDNYQKLEDAIMALQESNAFAGDELSKNSLFSAMYARFNEMKDGVEAYNTSVSNLNANLAQQTMLIALQNTEIPKTEEAFEIFKQELIDTAIASEQFIGNEKDIANVINNYLSTVPDFAGFYSIPLEQEIEKVDTLLSQEVTSTNTISETIDKLNTELKPSFDALGEAYQEIFILDGNNKEVFSLENVDLSMLDSIKSTIDEINENEELGIHIDYTDFENFTRVLTDASSTSDQVKTAFNDFATSMFDAVDATEGMSESTAQLMGAMLESMGVTNANEVVMHELALSEEEARIASIDWSSEIGVLVQELFNEANMASITKDEIYKLAMQEIAFGNNDLKVSDKIEKLKALAQAYGDTATEAIAAAAADRVANGHGDYDSVFSDMIASANRLKSENAIEIDFGKIDTSSVSKAGSKAGDAYLEAFEKEVSELQYLLDKDVIREFDYYDELDKLNKKYFEGRAEYLEEYRSNEVEVYKFMKEHNAEVTDQLQSELDDLQSGYEGVKDAVDTYNEYGKITLDQGQELLDTDFRLLAIMNEEESAYYSLANAKLEEMKVQLARNAIDAVNGLQTEAQAVEYLANANINLRNTSLSATEALLQQAVALKQAQGGSMAEAATTIYQGYQNAIKMVGNIDLGFSIPEKSTSSSSKESSVTEKKFNETLDWIEKFLENLSKKTEKLLDKVDKFISWQKKNAMINRAITSTDKEIAQNQVAYHGYMNKANKVGLSASYIKKIHNGSLEIEDITDESLNDKIESYMEWYDKAQGCLDTVEELYDQERDLIRQKLDNVIDYYSDMDSYLSSITSKVESLISLNDAMGKRSSLTELLQQFSDLSAQLSNVTQTEIKTSVTEINFGESDKVKEAIKRDKQAEIDAIQAEIDNLDVDQSGTYAKLLKNIAKTEAQIDKYIDKGWDVTKEKQFNKLIAKLDNYYDLQAELDAHATSNTIANYSKVYTAFQKLQNKLDNGGTLSKGQQKKYDSYLEQLEQMRNDKDDILTELETELGIAQGTIKDSTAEQKARQAIADVRDKLESTATYQNILNSIEQTEQKIAKLDEKGYDNLTKAQKKTYDKLVQTLEDYYEKKDAFDENATASTIAQYDKIYTAWKKLQDKLDAGQNLSTSQWKQYNKYTEQLKEFEIAKDDMMADLESQLDEIINPKDKLSVIDSEYEETAEDIYNSYQRQIEGVRNAITETTQYQNLLAKAQSLEKKKDTKGLSKTEQNNLNKYNAELEALRNGGTVENISNYMKTWEKWYALQQKLNKNGKLSATDAKNYDTYTAQLEAWNKEKQSQINDLVSLMEDELEALQKTYVENVSEAESEVSDYYANLYDLAKQIAEYNLTTLESQLSFLEAYISYYQQLVTLYDQFSGDKLATLLSDLDIGLAESQESLYAQYLDKLNQKYDATLSKINEYNELIEAIDTNDFEGSMQLFQDAIAEYKASGQTEMANKLQSVLDLLNERAVDQDNWGEYADKWLIEWEEALASAKNELISIAGSIQEVNDALREIKFSNITGTIQELSNAQDMLASITGLINDDWLYDENDNLTQHGLTKVGLLVEQMNSAKLEASRYAELIQSIQDMQSTYSSDEAYQTALQEAKMNYLTSLSDLQSYQDSIVSILVKADETVINSLTDVINKRKEALQKKKELYDYGKTIDKSQKEVDSIKAQIDALESLSGAMDTATKAKLAQLKADLAEKEEALQNTKDEHTYNLQIDALDEFLATLSDTMSSTTESVNKSFETYISAINSALELYNQNKDYLNDWSNSIIETVSGLGDSLGSTVELDTNVSDLSDAVNATDISLPSSSMISVETQNAIKECQDILKNGVLVKVDNPLQVGDTQLFNLMNSYMPQMALGVNNTIPNLIKGMNNQTVVNVHYDSLIHIDKNSNIDENFIKKQVPPMIEQSFHKLYRDLKILR